MKLQKLIAITAVAASTFVMSSYAKADTPSMDKLLVQYKSFIAGRFPGRYMEFSNVSLSNVSCKDRGMRTICTADATGEVSVRNSLNGTVDTHKLNDKNFEMKFFNRDAVRKQ